MATIKKEQTPVHLTTNGTQNVFLTIHVGAGQKGSSIVFFQNGIVFPKGKIVNLDIGKDLAGKTLKVVTNVLDANPDSNRIEIIHSFQNATPFQTAIHDKVENDGDVFTNISTYTF